MHADREELSRQSWARNPDPSRWIGRARQTDRPVQMDPEERRHRQPMDSSRDRQTDRGVQADPKHRDKSVETQRGSPKGLAAPATLGSLVAQADWGSSSAAAWVPGRAEQEAAETQAPWPATIPWACWDSDGALASPGQQRDPRKPSSVAGATGVGEVLSLDVVGLGTE